MNIKSIYELKTIHEVEGYKTPKWCDHDAFDEFTIGDIDFNHFIYTDACKDERIKLELKAAYNMSEHYHHEILEYVAISFDGQYIGLVIGRDTPFGWNVEDSYITNYPLYQAMVAYVRAMYIYKTERIVDETEDVEDLDGRYQSKIDKRHKYNMRKEDK